MQYFCCRAGKDRHHLKADDTCLVRVPYQRGATPSHVVRKNNSKATHRYRDLYSESPAYSLTFLLLFPVVPLMQSFPMSDFIKKIHSKTLCIQYNPIKGRKTVVGDITRPFC